MSSIPSQLNFGSFIPTTFILDVARLYEVDVKSPEFKELLVRLYQTVNSIALSTNTRDAGYYVLEEFLNGQLFFQIPSTITNNANPQMRQVYRTVVNFGALPNAGATSVAHNIDIASMSSGGTNPVSFTRIYGAATKPTTAGGLSYLPIPYVSTVGNHIELFVDDVNVNIRTTIDYSAYTITYVVLEYIKS